MRPAPWLGRMVLAGAILAAFGGGCQREIVGAPPPLDRPHFPTGVTLHPDGRLLAVVSSNFDLAFSRGALLVVDLDLVDERIEGLSRVVTLEDAFTDAAIIPPFGNEPIFARGGEHVLLSTRGENNLFEIPLDVEDGLVGFDCPVSEELGAPVCGEPPSTAQVPGNDPVDIAIISENEERITGIVTLLSSPNVFYFRLNLGRDDDNRLEFPENLPSFSLENEIVAGIPRGVRGLALRPASDGAQAQAFLTVERTAGGQLGRAVELVWFDANRGARNGVNTLNLTEQTGSIEVRGLALSPTGDAIFVLLRNPDAIARIDLASDDGRVTARFGGIVSTCYQPIDVVSARLEPEEGPVSDRVYVTCFNNDAILAYEPLTLVETAALRNMGRGPYSLAVDTEHVPPRLYVSFFLEDTVGVIDLTDDEGAPALVPRALLGTPRAREGVQR